MTTRKLVRGLILLFAGWLAFSCAAQATSYYVAKSGNDSNTGLSKQQAWLTIGHAAQVVQAGSTVYVGAGVYHESVNFGNSGTASAPIIFNGQGVAVVNGSSGVPCCSTPSFVSRNGFLCCTTQGLFNIGAAAGVNYLTGEGFVVQTSAPPVPPRFLAGC